MKVGLHTRLKPGAEERYEEYHRAVWPEVLEGMRRVGITKYVIFRDGLDLFHYIECDDYARAIGELARSPLNQRWEDAMAPMTEVAHDFSGEGDDQMSLIFDL
jgi:L-rhamnose mutarotase